jgi:hypothetical protein
MSHLLSYLDAMLLFASMILLASLWVASFIFAFCENKSWLILFFFFFPPLGVFYAIYQVLKEHAQTHDVSVGGMLRWIHRHLNQSASHTKRGD